MNGKPIVVFDIDGTLADASHRLYLIQNPDGKKDWDTFYNLCYEDKPIPQGIAVVRMFIDEIRYGIEFWTGRRESIRNSTRDWLVDHVGIRAAHLPIRMRKDGDWRSQQELKESYIAGRQIFIAFDDWEPVIAMYRRKGIIAYQVSGTTVHV